MWWGEVTRYTSGRWGTGRGAGRQAYYIKGGDVCIPSKEFALRFTIFGPKVSEIGFIDLKPKPQSMRITDGIHSSDSLQWIVTLEVQLEANDDNRSLARIPVERDTVLEKVHIILRNALAQSFSVMDHSTAQSFTNEDPTKIVAAVGGLVEARTPYRLIAVSITNVSPADQSALDIVEKKRRAAITEGARVAIQKGKIQTMADEASIDAIKQQAERELDKVNLAHSQELERRQAEHEREMVAQRAVLLENQRAADLHFRVHEMVLLAKAQSDAAAITDQRQLAHQTEVDKQNHQRLLSASDLSKDLRTVLALGVDGALNIAEIEKQIEIAKAKSKQQALDGILKFAVEGAVVSGQLNTLSAMLKKQNLLPANYAITFGSPLSADETAPTAPEDAPPAGLGDEED